MNDVKAFSVSKLEIKITAPPTQSYITENYYILLKSYYISIIIYKPYII